MKIKTTQEIEKQVSHLADIVGENDLSLRKTFLLVIIILIMVGGIGYLYLQSQIIELPKRVCWNETEYMNELEFCFKFTNELWIKELGNFSYFYDLCVNGSVYNDFVKYEKDYLIKSTKEVCNIQ